MARTPANPTKYHQQYMDNMSFDDEFRVNTVEVLGHDGTNLTRLKTDSDGHLQSDVLSITGMPQVSITNAIDSTAFDVNAAPFSATSNVTSDYILDSIELNFTTAQSKTITVTSSDGTVIYKDTNVETNISIGDINIAMNANENFTVAVTQTSGACSMDCIAKVREGSSTLGGSPSLGASTNLIGITYDYETEVARGNVSGHSAVIKFGEAPSGVQTSATDIWDRADATPTQQIWLAPTAARVHAIASTDDNDGKTSAPSSTGARTVRIYGLKTWASAETSEDVTLDGTTPVNTANSYVIIHRMKAITYGNSGPNIGTITATAAAPDSTVTAAILPGNGQTEMAIYGVPSTQSLYIYRWSANIDKSSGAVASCDFRLTVNESPNVNTLVYLRKDDISLQSTGTNQFDRHYAIPYKVAGPCIVKIQGIASANDLDGEAGFSGVLINN